MSSTDRTFIDGGERADVNESCKARRINLGSAGHENYVHTILTTLFKVRFKCPRISGEVLVRTELRRIHKDGDDHVIAFGPGASDQRSVPGVQGAHRGHESDRPTN